MSNPIPPPGNSAATRMSTQGGRRMQVISDTKWSQKNYAIGVIQPQLDFFLSAPSADPTVDNYDAGGQLVTSAKGFTIQALCVNILASVIADVNAFIQYGIVVLTAQQKEIGRFRLRHLCASGGPFVAGAQVAAASSVGVTNGSPDSDPWLIEPLFIDTNQTFKASIWMPITTPITTTSIVTAEIALCGFEARPAA